MARPKREGLDYFPLDVNAGIDDEIELIEAEYGLEGFAIFIKLLQKIYKTNYYIMWTEKEKLQFSKRVNVDINRVNVIIMACLKWDLFNKNLYDTYQILTSRGIQKRFLLAIDRRTSYEFYREYLLLSENEINVYKNLIIVNITTDNADINPQIEIERESKEKVKESKEKVNDNVSVPETHTQSLELCKYYEQLKPGENITSHLATLKIWIEKYGFDWTKEVIQMCVSSKNKFIVPWVEKVLQNWQSEGKPAVNTGNYKNKKPSGWDLKNQKQLEPGLEEKLLENSAGEDTGESLEEMLKKTRGG